VSAKHCQNFRERQVTAARNARLDGPLKVMPLTRRDADVCQVFGFAIAVAVLIAGAKQFGARGVAHSGDLFALADFERPEPQLVVPARQRGIEGGPFWQIAQLQNPQRKFLHT